MGLQYEIHTPRKSRIDAPDALYHIIARGIGRKRIFKDGNGRDNFLERLENILEETQPPCFAWTIIPNHFHLLLRSRATPVSRIMQRLLTSYTVYFNSDFFGDHRRSGHLFQNRYKSILCEEDNYLLELVRYIHLNLLRARIISDFKLLDKNPYCGHALIKGNRQDI